MCVSVSVCVCTWMCICVTVTYAICSFILLALRVLPKFCGISQSSSIAMNEEQQKQRCSQEAEQHKPWQGHCIRQTGAAAAANHNEKFQFPNSCSFFFVFGVFIFVKYRCKNYRNLWKFVIMTPMATSIWQQSFASTFSWLLKGHNLSGHESFN